MILVLVVVEKNIKLVMEKMPLNKYIDHTILKPTCLVADIHQLCDEAKMYAFAAVCVPPNFVKLAKTLTAGTDVKVATVIGFPFGYSATEAKIAEIILAMVDGADELDVVANISAIKNGDWMAIADEINHIMPVIRSKGKIVKIIIESGVLTDDEMIKCCDIYGIAGIDYLKTSTGYAEKGASIEAVKLFKSGKIIEGRQQLVQYIGMYPNNLEIMYTWAYNNLDLWGNTQEKRDASIVIIRNSMAALSTVAIPELSLSAMLVELTA
jgi:deoxyribose-phosphate aldolase